MFSDCLELQPSSLTNGVIESVLLGAEHYGFLYRIESLCVVPKREEMWGKSEGFGIEELSAL